MPALIVLSSVFPSWLLGCTCLAAGAAAVIVLTVLFAMLTQPRPHPDNRTAPRRDRALKCVRTMRSCIGNAPAGRSKAARKERLRCQA